MKNRKIFLIIVGVLIIAFLLKTTPLDEYWTNIQHAYYQNINKKAVKNETEDKKTGEIASFTFTPKAYGNIQKEVKLYLPADYKNEIKRYPALYLLHGFPGNNSDWIINADLKNQLDDLIGNGKLPPFIVVFPDGNGPTIKDTQYVNATKITQPAEDYIVEVVREIETRFRIINIRESRGIGGLSAGAYGAVNIGFHHSDIFSILISHSGYYINNENVTKSLLNNEDLSFNNPMEFIEKQRLTDPMYIYFDIGRYDNKTYITQNRELDMILTENGIAHEFNITDGWHDWNVWRKNITKSLFYFAKHIKT